MNEIKSQLLTEPDGALGLSMEPFTFYKGCNLT